MNTSVLLVHPAIDLPLSTHGLETSTKLHVLNLQKALKSSHASLVNIALRQTKKTASQPSYTPRILGWALALAIHGAVIYLISHSESLPEVLPTIATPITVSIIAPPSPDVKPKPEIVPTVKPVEVIKKPVVQPKKIVEKIEPVESPKQPVFEATTETVEQKTAPVEEVAAPVVIKAAANPAPVEEKIELPKFGVAYLNNPAPEYPKMAKRTGEEGRVLLKVLVSAEGLAETVNIEKSSGSARLDQAATEAVGRWKFVPARKGGQPLSAYVIVPINFSLDD